MAEDKQPLVCDDGAEWLPLVIVEDAWRLAPFLASSAAF